MSLRRWSRPAAAVSALALVALTLFTAGIGPREARAANAYNILIADNLGKRLVVTDPYGRIKWQWKNPLNDSNTYSGPLGAKWVAGNRILATFGTGVVGLIDPATKTFIWKFYGCQTSNWLQSPYDAEILPDGNLAIAMRYNEGGRVAVYNRQGCQIVWKYLLSNAHSVRLYQPGYGTSLPTLLMGGWGQTAEATYQSGVAPKVVWSYPTEYTHDAMVIPGGNIVTVEGYYIQELTRAKSRVWKVMTPDEERRVAVNPDGGFIFSVANADRIEFRDTNGNLLRTFSYLSDGSKLDLPYAVQVVCWPDLCSGGTSPTPTPSATATATPTPTPTASSGSTTTLFSDGFSSTSFSSGWTVRTGGDGSASIQTSVVQSGTYAARFSATANAGSYGYARRTLGTPQSRLTASAWLRIDQEGVSGGNVPLLRLFDGNGARVLSLYRQNASGGAVWLQYGGSYWGTGSSLGLGSWARFDVSVVVNGSASTVTVRRDGTTIYATSAASLGTNPIAAVQVGNDTASQPFVSYADDVSATTP